MQAVVLAGNGSQDRGPERRGSPASDAREPVRPDPPGTGGSLDHLRELFRRFDRAFSRTFTAMAMAEDGTRDLALEELEEDDEPAGDEPAARD